MVPVFDVVRSSLSLIKVGLFLAFLALYIAFAPDITSTLTQIVNKAIPYMNQVDNLDLGCFAGLIGLDAFINAIINSIYVASGVYISSIASVLTVKYTIILFSLVMRI